MCASRERKQSDSGQKGQVQTRDYTYMNEEDWAGHSQQGRGSSGHPEEIRVSAATVRKSALSGYPRKEGGRHAGAPPRGFLHSWHLGLLTEADTLATAGGLITVAMNPSSQRTASTNIS